MEAARSCCAARTAPRPGRRDGGRRQPERVGRGRGRLRALRLPDLRLVLRHVHRNSMNCLTSIGSRCPATARCSRRMPTARPVPRGGPPRGRAGAALVRAGRRLGAAALHRELRAFENAMSLDIAMGGSTNTVLHLLAAAHEPASTSRCRTSTAESQGPEPVQGRAGDAAVPHGDVHGGRRDRDPRELIAPV